MPRPKCARQIACRPEVVYFKPRGVPLRSLVEVVLEKDELEALRLADCEGLYQEEAALRMKISRPTFGRIIDSAHRKVAEALLDGKALRIDGGNVEMVEERNFKCRDCGHEWAVAFGTGRPQECPNCRSLNLHRSDRGFGQGGGRRNRGQACRGGGQWKRNRETA
ncbi:conserved hypothetical protein [Candidatus Zixiibacteriota bacterium]|nr:conserved hypothetical protein [candidate division Zixibacteria bacterium]